MAGTTETLLLLRRWNGGDRVALGALLERHLEWVRAFVHRRLGEELRAKAETQDLVQEALLRFLEYGPRLEVQDEARFRALLARVAENAIRDQARHMHRLKRDAGRERVCTDSVLRLDPPVAAVTSPSEYASREERRAWVRLAIELLPPEDREVILLREWDGLDFPRIASELGISEEAAKKRFQRALPRLADRLVELRSKGLGTVVAGAGEGE